MADQSLGMRIKHLRGDARREALSQVVSEYKSSGLSPAAFCKSVGIATVTLSRWQRELRRAPSSKAAAPRIVEVRPSASAQPLHFELSLPSGAMLRVPHGFDGSDLARLLATLNASC